MQRIAQIQFGLCLWLCLCLAAPVLALTQITGVRLWNSADKSRLVLDCKAPIEHKVFALGNPERVVMDLSDVQLQSLLPEVPKDSPHVLGLRSAIQADGKLRLVLDVKKGVRYDSFLLKPFGQYEHRLVVDLFSDKQTPQTPVREMSQLEKEEGLRDLIIAIDAGHGGEDPGAIGRKGTFEKDITLAIAKELERLVLKTPGMKPFMVRKGDYFVSLRNRIKKAREARADFFVSIHADSFTNHKAHGSSVYILSDRGASSEAARWLAEKENHADLIGGVGDVSLKDKDQLLASVLLDLSQTATIEASHQAGEKVLSSLGRVNDLHKKQVEMAGFVVLKSPDVPSILVETAFLSNRKEEKKLRTKAHQKRLARAILTGIKRYFQAYPLPGTQFALKEYKVRKGDTLSGIANAFNVSMDQLKAVNALQSELLRVGQVLKLPQS